MTDETAHNHEEVQHDETCPHFNEQENTTWKEELRKKRRHILSIVLIFAFFLFLFLWRSFFQTDFSGTVYIDRSATASGNGSRARPFQDLQEVIDLYADNGSRGQLQISLGGAHEGDFLLPVGTRLSGRDGDIATITGTLEITSDVEVRNLRVTGPGAGIIVREGSTVVLESVDVSDNTAAGIDSGTESHVTITDARVFHNGEKGISIGPASHATITNSEVKRNGKEGIDLAGAVEGTITGNAIEENEQSGIEYVLGESIGLIQNNSIVANGASGVTVQFHEDYPLLGNVKIVGNELIENTDFGIECTKPSEGKKPKRYYENATIVEENYVDGNKNDPIAKKCGFEI